MNTGRSALTFSAIGIALAAIGGCGGSSSSGLSAAVRDAVVEAASSADNPIDVSKAEGSCIADKVLSDEAAATALAAADKAGKTGQEMLDAVDSTDPMFAKSVFQCLELEKIVGAFSSGMTADGKVTAEQTECLIGAFGKLDRDVLAEALTSGTNAVEGQTIPDNIQAAMDQLSADVQGCTATSTTLPS